MRRFLLIALLLATLPCFAAGAAPEPQDRWKITGSLNTRYYLSDEGLLIVTLKISNQSQTAQTLEVPRFWHSECDAKRLGFAGWINGHEDDFSPLSDNQGLPASLEKPAPTPTPTPDPKPSDEPGIPVPGPAAMGAAPNSWTDVVLAPGASFERSWNWRDSEMTMPPADFSFRMGLDIQGAGLVWSAPIAFRHAELRKSVTDGK